MKNEKSSNRKLFALVMWAIIIGLIVFIVIATNRMNGSRGNNDASMSEMEHYVAGLEVIPGIAAVDLHGNLTQQGFELEKNLYSDYPSWRCTQEVTAHHSYEATAYGKRADEITKVTASALNYTDQSTDTVVGDFIAYIASLPYDGSDPRRAQAWVRENINTTSSTVIGGVKLELTANGDRSRMLSIYPE